MGNGHLVILKQQKYWILQEDPIQVPGGYPQPVNSTWPEMHNLRIDGVFHEVEAIDEDYEKPPEPGTAQKSDAIYFISNREVYRYSTIDRKMDKKFPVKVAGFFGGCKRRRKPKD